MGTSASRFWDDVYVDTSLLRHPGLVPGPTQKGRDLKSTLLDVSKIPDIAGGDSGTTDGNIAGGDSGTTDGEKRFAFPGRRLR